LAFADDDTLLESAGLYNETEIHFLSLKDSSTFSNTKPQMFNKYFGEGAHFVSDNDG